MSVSHDSLSVQFRIMVQRCGGCQGNPKSHQTTVVVKSESEFNPFVKEQSVAHVGKLHILIMGMNNTPSVTEPLQNHQDTQ